MSSDTHDTGSAADRWLARTRTVVEIAAILVAGYWAYTRFLAGEAPSLEPSFRITGALDWHSVTDSGCLAEYRIEMSNIGKTSIEVVGVELKVWVSDPPETENQVEFIDPASLKTGEPYTVSPKQDLAQYYAPGASDRIGFNFVLKKAPGKIALFQVNFPSLEGYGRAQSWYDYQWDWVCGETGAART